MYQNGNSDCLKCAHENGYERNENTLNEAILNGHLKYAYQNGCAPGTR